MSNTARTPIYVILSCEKGHSKYSTEPCLVGDDPEIQLRTELCHLCIEEHPHLTLRICALCGPCYIVSHLCKCSYILALTAFECQF